MSEGDVQLIEFPDVKTMLRRSWPRLANRAALCVLLPLSVTMLAQTLNLYGPLAQLALPLTFLDVGPFPYEAKVVAFLVLILLLGAFLIRDRATQLVLGLATGSLLWTGFMFTRLRWTKLFLPNYDPLLQATPSFGAWAWAGLALASALAFVLVEAHLDTRSAYAQRAVPDAEASAAARASAETVALTLAGGLGGALVLALLFWAIRPLLAAWSLRLNPVFVLFGLGGVAVGAIVLAARKRPVTRKR